LGTKEPLVKEKGKGPNLGKPATKDWETPGVGPGGIPGSQWEKFFRPTFQDPRSRNQWNPGQVGIKEPIQVVGS